MLVADESVDFRIVEALRSLGIDIYAIVEQNPSIVDEDVLNIAVQLNAPLLTEDKDFGELVFRLQLPHIRCFIVAHWLYDRCSESCSCNTNHFKAY